MALDVVGVVVGVVVAAVVASNSCTIVATNVIGIAEDHSIGFFVDTAGPMFHSQLDQSWPTLATNLSR